MGIKYYDEQAIVNFYKKHPISLTTLSATFNLCKPTLSKILLRNGCNLYSKQELNRGNLKVNYFEHIDTEIKAYLLGLFMADGCIFTNNAGTSKLFNIQLNVIDAYMIEFVKNELCAPRKIVTDKRDNSKSITIINNQFVQHLMNYGMVEHKSERFLPSLNDSLLPHFIRGLFDGDGSITHKEAISRRNPQWCIVILAHKKIFEPLKEILIQKLSLNNNIPCVDGNNVYSMRWANRKDFLTLTHYMYDNASIYLERKFKKYQDALYDFSLR